MLLIVANILRSLLHSLRSQRILELTDCIVNIRIILTRQTSRNGLWHHLEVLQAVVSNCIITSLTLSGSLACTLHALEQ